MTMKQLIRAANQKAAQSGDWGARHAAAWTAPTGTGAAIVEVVQSLAKYADAHKARFGSTVGQDAVIGDGWKNIAQGVLTLLNGDLGGLDGGTMDSIVRDMMTASNVDPDTGDLFYEPK